MDGLGKQCPLIINPHYTVLQLTPRNAAYFEIMSPTFSKQLGSHGIRDVLHEASIRVSLPSLIFFAHLSYLF